MSAAEVFHPGEYLRDELAARGLTQAKLAEKLGVSQSTVTNLAVGRIGISVPMAIGLEEVLGISARSWLNLQTAWDLQTERARMARAGRRLEVPQ